MAASASTDSDHDEDEQMFQEEDVIRYYFSCGFDYEEILCFLEKRHKHPISYSTLLRRLKQYGLSRRGITDKEDFGNVFEEVQRRIHQIVHGSGSSGGYRSVWHTLEMEGLKTPRIIVQDLLKEIDPDGTDRRKRHCLKRRLYNNPGPNYAWHIDGYDKLKPWGFPIHGAIDGYSRKVLWLEVTRSNNSPNNVASFYLKTVSKYEGCPVELITDLGTENGLAASTHAFFRGNPDAHRYVPSPRNQRIEGWWSYLAKSCSNWWRGFFSDLEFKRTVDTASELSMECLWYCFSRIIQKELDQTREHWNTHKIRKSGPNTISGRPDSLYFLPELHGAVNNLKMDVPQEDMNYAKQHIVEECESNDFQDYFNIARTGLSLPEPQSWEDAIKLYKNLVHLAAHGRTLDL